MRQADLIPVIDKLAAGEGETADLTFEATTFGEVLAREVETGGGKETKASARRGGDLEPDQAEGNCAA